MKELTGGVLPVQIAPGYEITAPGLEGTVREIAPTDQAFRSEGAARAVALEEALGEAGLATEAVFEMDVVDVAPSESEGARAAGDMGMVTREGEPAFELAVPAFGINVGHAVLYTDEGGVSRWFLPEGRSNVADPSRGAGDAVLYRLPRPGAPSPPPPGTSGMRGPLAKIGRRLIRVLTWATDPIVGAGARVAARAWENAKRPYGFIRLEPAGIQGDPDWPDLGKGRALLLLHGTFSTAGSGFLHFAEWDGLPDLLSHYGGRAFAFNHPTMHASPAENAEQFFQMLPPESAFECDLITHSRGGLVGRELIERATDQLLAGRKLSIRRAIFVAAPQNGTALADGEHLLDFIDRYTNLLTWLPDTAFTLILEALLAALKLLAHGGLPGLPGLHSMLPKGPYLSQLNPGVAGHTRYHAIAANFTPADPNLLARFTKSVGNALLDRIFNEDNDGVVPTGGAFELGVPGGAFPIPRERRLLLEKDAQVHHCNFFANPAVNRQIANWLTSD